MTYTDADLVGMIAEAVDASTMPTYDATSLHAPAPGRQLVARTAGPALAATAVVITAAAVVTAHSGFDGRSPARTGAVETRPAASITATSVTCGFGPATLADGRAANYRTLLTTAKVGTPPTVTVTIPDHPDTAIQAVRLIAEAPGGAAQPFPAPNDPDWAHLEYPEQVGNTLITDNLPAGSQVSVTFPARLAGNYTISVLIEYSYLNPACGPSDPRHYPWNIGAVGFVRVEN
jgi:hypothetical protein